MHRLAGKVVDRGDRGSLGAYHDKFRDRLAIGLDDEIYLTQSFVCDGQVPRGDVAEAVHQFRQQLVARRRDEVDGDRSLSGLEFAIDVLLEIPDELGREPALASFVVEIQRAAVWHEDADHAPLDDPVEVTGPGLFGKA